MSVVMFCWPAVGLDFVHVTMDDCNSCYVYCGCKTLMFVLLLLNLDVSAVAYVLRCYFCGLDNLRSSACHVLRVKNEILYSY